MDTIKSKYAHLIGEIIAHVPKNAHVSEENVYQQGIAALLPYIDTIIHDYIDDCSDIEGIENLASLHAHAKRGESCLLLMEHYSNFDLPVFHYLLRRSGQKGEEIASDIVAIAGIKLNEENPAVHAFARAYSRIVIYPSRSMQIIKEKYKDPKELYQEIKRSISINHAAMKALSAAKESGKLILVFPAGTALSPMGPVVKTRRARNCLVHQVFFQILPCFSQRKYSQNQSIRRYGRRHSPKRQGDLQCEPRP